MEANHLRQDEAVVAGVAWVFGLVAHGVEEQHRHELRCTAAGGGVSAGETDRDTHTPHWRRINVNCNIVACEDFYATVPQVKPSALSQCRL